MKTLFLFIILFAFMQASVLSINLVLVLLIARSLAVDDKAGLLLAFFSGLLLSFLTQVNLGYWPLIFLLIMKTGFFIRKLPISFNLLMIFIAGSVLVLLNGILNKIFMNTDFNFFIILFEAILIVPAYFLIRFWEERFVAKSHIKLKI